MRTEFPAKIKLAAFQAANGCCQSCGLKITKGPQYDHRIPDRIGGKATLDNCELLCTPCHSFKTSTEDAPRIAKTRRIEKKNAGVKTKKSRPIPGSKASGWKHTMSGEWVRR